MINWFRDRKKGQRPWFKLDCHLHSIQGEKAHDGALLLTISSGGKSVVSMTIERKLVEDLTHWLMRNYPQGGARVIPLDRNRTHLKLIDTLSLPRAETSPEGSPRDPTT